MKRRRAQENYCAKRRWRFSLEMYALERDSVRYDSALQFYLSVLYVQ